MLRWSSMAYVVVGLVALVVVVGLAAGLHAAGEPALKFARVGEIDNCTWDPDTRWSSDGKWLLFGQLDMKTSDRYLRVYSPGGRTVTVAKVHETWNTGWADSHRVWYLESERLDSGYYPTGPLVIFDVLTGKSSTVQMHTEVSRPVMAVPGAETLIYSSSGKLCTRSLQPRKWDHESQLMDMGMREVSSMRASANGRTVVVFLNSKIDGQGSTYAIDLSAPQPRIVELKLGGGSFACNPSPDGKSVAYVKHHASGGNLVSIDLCLVDLKSGKEKLLEKLERHGRAAYLDKPAFSPDGRRIAYLRRIPDEKDTGGSDLILYDIRTGKTTAIPWMPSVNPPEHLATLEYPSWSSDSTLLAISAYDPSKGVSHDTEKENRGPKTKFTDAVVIVDVASHRMTLAPCPAGTAVWSPTKRQLAVTHRKSVGLSSVTVLDVR